MIALSNNPAFWIALITGLVVLYVLPSLIGAIRKVEGLGWLIVVNLVPTGIGWLAAMVLAIMLPRRDPPTTYPGPRAPYPPASDARTPSQHWQ